MVKPSVVIRKDEGSNPSSRPKLMFIAISILTLVNTVMYLQENSYEIRKTFI